MQHNSPDLSANRRGIGSKPSADSLRTSKGKYLSCASLHFLKRLHKFAFRILRIWLLESDSSVNLIKGLTSLNEIWLFTELKEGL